MSGPPGGFAPAVNYSAAAGVRMLGASGEDGAPMHRDQMASRYTRRFLLNPPAARPWKDKTESPDKIQQELSKSHRIKPSPDWEHSMVLIIEQYNLSNSISSLSSNRKYHISLSRFSGVANSVANGGFWTVKTLSSTSNNFVEEGRYSQSSISGLGP